MGSNRCGASDKRSELQISYNSRTLQSNSLVNDRNSSSGIASSSGSMAGSHGTIRGIRLGAFILAVPSPRSLEINLEPIKQPNL